MGAPARVGLFVAGLAVAFLAALGVGNLAGDPLGDSTPPADHGEPGGAHGDGAHGDGAHGDGAHGDAAADSAPAGLQVSVAGHTLSPINAPTAVGEHGRLSFQIAGPDGQPVTRFHESHEKDLHLIVVRTDTQHYRHVHPELDPDGTWHIDWQWSAAGTYKVFADFEPAALGQGLTLARTVEVGGDHTPHPLPAITTTTTVDDYTVRLTGELHAGEATVLTAIVERDGRPVDGLEPYLGAFGHLVALRDGDLAYVHVHPENGAVEPVSEVPFRVQAPTAGVYRLFFDFQVAGQVHTADFTLTAAG